MIAVDTNIVMRLLSRDDEVQFQRARRLFSTNSVFISTTVALECEWVLQYAYKFSPQEIVAALRRLFGLKDVVLEDGERVAMALEWHEQGLDFADALHLAASPEGTPFYTFDRKLIKASRGVSRQDVREPD